MSGLLRSSEGDIVASMQGKECWTWAKAGSAIFFAMLVIALLIGIFKPSDWPTLFAPVVFVGVGLPFLLFGCLLTALCRFGRL